MWAYTDGVYTSRRVVFLYFGATGLACVLILSILVHLLLIFAWGYTPLTLAPLYFSFFSLFYFELKHFIFSMGLMCLTIGFRECFALLHCIVFLL